MKKILIPTDFSDNAADALGYALHLMKGQKVQLHILNVVQSTAVPAEVPIDTTELLRVEMDNARESLQALEVFCEQFYGDDENAEVKVTTNVEVGGVGYQIKQEAERVKADLIIMGTQGTNHSLSEKIFGTISTSAIDHAPCPVILIPKGYKFKNIDNVIFATNLNHKDPYELWRATEVIKPHIGRVRCLYVTKDKTETDKKELEQFAKYMVEHSPSVQTIFNVEESQNIEQTISQYAENYDAEMIIMHRSKKTFWKSLFSSRHTKKMATWIHVPLMVLNNRS
ncbi:MAG: nucleotide-binding universal stress UspA family protein [Saprospiraceae bacterium]|jgi:nucleotide-binding universal stress UspA family protein